MTDNLNSDEYFYRLKLMFARDFSLWEYICLNKMEALFQLFKWICANWFNSSQSLILFSSIFTQGIILRFFYRSSFNFPLAIFIYLMSGVYFQSFVAINQYMAIAMITYSLLFINTKRHWPYYVAVLIATLFHSSSIMLLPLPLLNRFKFTPFKCVAICLISLFVGKYFQFLLPLFSGTAYASYQTADFFFYGVNYFRVLFWGIQYAFVLFAYFQLRSLRDSSKEIMWWFLLLSLATYIASLYYVLFGRVQLFFGIVAITLTSCIPMCFDKKFRYLFYLLLVGVYCIYGYYVAFHTAEYHTCFTNTYLWI